MTTWLVAREVVILGSWLQLFKDHPFKDEDPRILLLNICLKRFLSQQSDISDPRYHSSMKVRGGFQLFFEVQTSQLSKTCRAFMFLGSILQKCFFEASQSWQINGEKPTFELITFSQGTLESMIFRSFAGWHMLGYPLLVGGFNPLETY